MCKKFEHLGLLIPKDKPKKNSQDIICHKCEKPGRYASQSQLIGSTTQRCGYCGRYGHVEEACYKKQADEARSKPDKGKTKDSFPKMNFRNTLNRKHRRRRNQSCLPKKQRIRKIRKKC